MKRVFLRQATIALAVSGGLLMPALGLADEEPGGEWEATHMQAAIIRVTDEAGEKVPLHAFCLDAQGRLLAGVGQGSGEIRRYDAEGRLLGKWPLPVQPEALHAASDGSLYVAGEGRLLKLNAEGRVLLDRKSPQATAVKENAARMREQILAQARQRTDQYQRQIDTYRAQLDRLKGKPQEELSSREQQLRQIYERQIELYQQVLERQAATPALSEEQVEQQVQRALAAKLKASSISATAEHVYLACSALVGYGFEVWRTDTQFENAEKIVSGLRGCCGQMDVKACGAGVYVAENSRHRVCHYDGDGKLIATWGQRDRAGVEGFGSCCNPMNVAFGPNGDVFTAESTLGRIKRYSRDGKLLALIGSVEIVPGCKNVSIAVNQDGSRVYMMDITRSHIVMMKRKGADADAAETTAAARED